jgi:hypothetical protein
MKKVFLSALVLSTMAMEAQQSFSGFRESPYAGVLQATTNPAYMISSKRSWDASLFVLNVGVGNDAIKLDTDINKSINDFARLDASNPLAKNNDINLRLNVDVLGPSLFVKLNDKHAVGIFTRVRALGNINNFDAKMIQSYISDYDKLELRNNYSLNLNDQEVVVHGFSEVGFSWAGELYFDGHNAIKAGASLKYIMGAGNLYAGFRDFNGTASLTTDPVTKKVNLNINSTNGTFDIINGGTDFLNNFTANSLMGKEASTIGFDLGATYEYRFDGCQTCYKKPHDLRIGFSIMDIGTVSYKTNKKSQRYKMQGGTVTLNMDEINEEKLKHAFGSFESLEQKTVKSSLPTTLNLSADYRIFGGLYVNASGLVNLTSKSKTDVYNAYYANTFSLTPRFDTSAFGAYLPISYNQVSKTNIGLGLRLGPLTFGSSSAISNLMKTARELNFFVGLRFGHMAYPNN